MNGEIKYRGRTEDGEWIYGSLIGKDVIVGPIVEWDSEYFNTEFWYKVDPETVGQYLKYFSHEFYRGDLLSICCDCDSEFGCTHSDSVYELVWSYERAGFALRSIRSGHIESLDEFGEENMRVIGNVWDNLHLPQAIVATEQPRA